jgi:hypothetical protein
MTKKYKFNSLLDIAYSLKKQKLGRNCMIPLDLWNMPLPEMERKWKVECKFVLDEENRRITDRAERILSSIENLKDRKSKLDYIIYNFILED